MTLSQVGEVWEGWKNYLLSDTLSDEQQDLAKKRLASCMGCKYAQERKIRKIINTITGQKGKVKVGKCGICDCPFITKLLSWASECPLPTYKEVSYPDPQRWGRVNFSEDGKLTTGENIYIPE